MMGGDISGSESEEDGIFSSGSESEEDGIFRSLTPYNHMTNGIFLMFTMFSPQRFVKKL